MSLLDDVGAKLVAAGVGTLGTNLYLSTMPDGPSTPDPCVAVYEVPSPAPDYLFGTDVPGVRNFGFQVVCRSADYEAARTKAELVYTTLSAIVEEAMGATTYRIVEAVQEPFGLGYDANQRALVACNFLASK